MRFEEIWSPATLVATRELAPRIREFLIKPDHGAVTPYPVGSHIKVGVVIDGRPDIRSYSLVGEAEAAGYRIAVRFAEDSRGGSRYMWSLAAGARLSVTAPSSLLQIDWQRGNYCLIAGGIGLADQRVGPHIGAAVDHESDLDVAADRIRRDRAVVGPDQEFADSRREVARRHQRGGAPVVLKTHDQSPSYG